jgi:transcriptional regulator with XRE-family HTH domain
MAPNFGQLISTARKKKGLSQRELAVQVGISGPYLNDIEHGRRNPPSGELVVKMAIALDIPEDHLCAVAGSMPADVQKAAIAQNPERFQQEFAAFRRAMGISSRPAPTKRPKKD